MSSTEIELLSALRGSPTVPWQQKKHDNVIKVRWHGLVCSDLFIDLFIYLFSLQHDEHFLCRFIWMVFTVLDLSFTARRDRKWIWNSVNNQLIRPIFKDLRLGSGFGHWNNLCCLVDRNRAQMLLAGSLCLKKCFLKSLLSAIKGCALL